MCAKLNPEAVYKWGLLGYVNPVYFFVSQVYQLTWWLLIVEVPLVLEACFTRLPSTLTKRALESPLLFIREQKSGAESGQLFWLMLTRWFETELTTDNSGYKEWMEAGLCCCRRECPEQGPGMCITNVLGGLSSWPTMPVVANTVNCPSLR